MKSRKKTATADDSRLVDTAISRTDDEIDDNLSPDELYIRNCKRFELQVDSSVLIALKTKWSLLQPTKTFSEGAMLPLMGILDNSQFVTKVNLSNVAMNDSRFVRGAVCHQ